MLRTPLVLPLTAALVACAPWPNVPEGWHDAELLNDFQQSECVGEPGQGATEELNGLVDATSFSLEWKNVQFRCEQPVEAYLKRLGVTHELLVQPIDMDPKTVARCDCLYDLDLAWNIDDSLQAVVIFKRADEYGGESDPAQIGRLNF